MKKNILVVCIHNSSRSQMAEEYIKKYGSHLFEAESAGLEPGKLNPYVIEVLKEEDIDISGKKTQGVNDLKAAGKSFHYVITVCDREAHEKCPVFPGTEKRLHWPFPDPSAINEEHQLKLIKTREIRDMIKDKVLNFIKEEEAEKD